MRSVTLIPVHQNVPSKVRGQFLAHLPMSATLLMSHPIPAEQPLPQGVLHPRTAVVSDRGKSLERLNAYELYI